MPAIPCVISDVKKPQELQVRSRLTTEVVSAFAGFTVTRKTINEFTGPPESSALSLCHQGSDAIAISFPCLERYLRLALFSGQPRKSVSCEIRTPTFATEGQIFKPDSDTGMIRESPKWTIKKEALGTKPY